MKDSRRPTAIRPLRVLKRLPSLRVPKLRVPKLRVPKLLPPLGLLSLQGVLGSAASAASASELQRASQQTASDAKLVGVALFLQNEQSLPRRLSHAAAPATCVTRLKSVDGKRAARLGADLQPNAKVGNVGI